MNQYAQIMFEMTDNYIDGRVERICSHALSQLNAEVTDEQRQTLRAEIRHEIEGLIFSLFGTFDNVGCGLPEEVSGYSIKIRRPKGASTDAIDMRENEADYADMWFDYLHNKSNQ